MQAPLERLNAALTNKPSTQKTPLIQEEMSIIAPSLLAKNSAIKLGILSIAITKISPTKRIEMTMQKANIAIKR